MLAALVALFVLSGAAGLVYESIWTRYLARHAPSHGAHPAEAERPPSNLVFLVGVSGSTEEPNKLPLLKRA